jgi:hypothetical protein
VSQLAEAQSVLAAHAVGQTVPPLHTKGAQTATGTPADEQVPAPSQ